LIDSYPQALKITNASGDTPLHAACCHYYTNNVDLIRFLVEKCPEVLESDYVNGTPLHTICRGNDGNLKKDRLDYLRVLAISEKAVKAKNKYGQSALHVLCRDGNGCTGDEIQVLLDKCPELPTVKDNQGRTPLHMAVQGSVLTRASRYAETVECLLESFPGSVQVADNGGMTPLELACARNADLTVIYQLVSVNPISTLGLESGRQATSPTRKRKWPL